MNKKFLAGAVAALLALTAVTPAFAQTNRVAGPDRYGTSLTVAQTYFPQAKTVYVATGKNFPDALAATPLAAKDQAPILLIGDALTQAQLDYIQKLKPRVVILGGLGVISGEIQAKLSVVTSTERIAGRDRYETAMMIAQRYGAANEVYVADGRGYADALAGGVLAARNQAPLVLTAPGHQIKVESVSGTVVIGGPGAVPESLLTTLPNPRRIYGANRFETSQRILEAKPSKALFMVSGYNFADALSISPVAAINDQPLLLTPKNCTWFIPQVPVTLVGGSGVLDDTVATTQCVPSMQPNQPAQPAQPAQPTQPAPAPQPSGPNPSAPAIPSGAGAGSASPSYGQVAPPTLKLPDGTLVYASCAEVLEKTGGAIHYTDLGFNPAWRDKVDQTGYYCTKLGQ